jgi:hypothetical protein
LRSTIYLDAADDGDLSYEDGERVDALNDRFYELGADDPHLVEVAAEVDSLLTRYPGLRPDPAWVSAIEEMVEDSFSLDF